MPVGLFDGQLSSSLAGARLFNDKWCWGVWRSLCMQWETWRQMYSHTEIRVQLLWCLYVPFFVLPDLIRRITDSNCGTFIMDEKTRSSIITSLINNWGPPDPTEVSKGLGMESMFIYDTCTWWKKLLLRWKKLNLDSSVQKASLCSLNILEVWSLPRARRVQWDIFGQRMQSLRSGWESRGNPLQIPSAGMLLSCLRIAGIVWVCVVLLKHSNFNDESSNIPRSPLWSLSLKSRALSFVWFAVCFLLHFQVVVSHRFLFLVSVYPYSWSFMLRFQVWSSLCVLSCISLCQVTYNSSVFLRYCCL